MKSLIRIAVALERIATALETNLALLQNKPIVIKETVTQPPSPLDPSCWPHQPIYPTITCNLEEPDNA